MLVNQLNEFKTGMRYPNGFIHDRALDPVKARVAKSEIFLMDRDACGMCASVSTSRPSTIWSSLPWVKLPFSSMWIEFDNAVLRAAMQEIGSPNKRPENTAVTIERSGFLIREEANTLILDYVHADRTDDGRRLIDLAPIQGRFSLKIEDDLKPQTGWPRFDISPSGASGRVKRHLDMIQSDPRELAASIDLTELFDWRPHPDMAPVRSEMVKMMGEGRVSMIEAGQADEMRRLFMLQILPSLILLNCRNAVETEFVGVSAKLNKNRVAKGKSPLADYRIIKMHLSPRLQRISSADPHDTSGRTVRGSLVAGHFKIRKSGIFWWSPHARAGYAEGPQRINVLTR